VRKDLNNIYNNSSKHYNNHASKAVEKELLEYLLSPLIQLPLEINVLRNSLPGLNGEDQLNKAVEKFQYQNLLETTCTSEKVLVISTVQLEKLSKLAEVMGVIRVKEEPLLNQSGLSYQEEVDYLLSVKSIRERECKQMGSDIQELLSTKSVMEQLKLQNFQSAGGSQLREFCYYKTKSDCRRAKNSKKACAKLHFHRIIHPHTDQSLGDCSFLNTCFHVETCKFVHYSIDDSIDEPEALPRKLTSLKTALPRTKLTPPQWIDCDLRFFDMTVIGKFAVIMADPPWDIHMELPYGTMGDDEMRQLNIPALQDEGYIFLWVTGRAMELGRECLTLWGYERVDELIWVKTNQLQRLIRTGRTGHWINHGKEHCLVGAKGNPSLMNKGIDTDVIVAEVRATSHKPDEIYGVIERLSPGTRKVELFGRSHNCQPNWMTLGNQLDGIKIVDPDISESFYAKYPQGAIDTMKPPVPTVT
jgi:mRNA (2'-O-methyladenosine-N6-)-methyltransferase